MNACERDSGISAGARKSHRAQEPHDGGHAMTGNSFGSRGTLRVGDTSYEIHRLDTVDGSGDLPFSLKVLLENLLRTEDGMNVTPEQVTALATWDAAAQPATEIQFSPA